MERRRAADGQPDSWAGAASDGTWYTAQQWAAWKARDEEQVPPAPAAGQRQPEDASPEAPEPARETGDVDQAPASPAATWLAPRAPAGVPQPVRAPAAPAAEQRQAAVAPAEVPEPARAPAAPAAKQRQAADPAEQQWGASNFLAVLLHNAGAALRPCTTLRSLLQAAHARRELLPMPADAFFNGDIRQALGSPDAFRVTIESINCICDPNRSGHHRIDMLVYHRCGAVTRHHPGASAAQSAKPHTIPHGSRTYSRDIALQQGIGAALHVHAPGLGADHVAAAEHGAPPLLVTEADLRDVHPVDASFVNAASLTAALARLPPGDTDWSHHGFPWWVFMAGRSHKFLACVQEGIIGVTGVKEDDLTRYMRVTTRSRVRVVSVNRRVQIEEV